MTKIIQTAKGDYSLRPFQMNDTGKTGYHIYPKGERSHWSIKATLYPSARFDGMFTVSMNRYSIEPAPSFDEAVKLVRERLEA